MKITPKYRLLGWVMYIYATAVWRTAKFRAVGLEQLMAAKDSGRPLIIALWHGLTGMVFGFVATRLNQKLLVIVPDDHRGATLSVAIHREGGETFPISMDVASMVAARRLLALIREMKRGGTLFLNPDGPDGPAHSPKEGVVHIARKSSALLLPAAAFTTTCFRVPRWDRYVVPFPFSRITVVFCKPLDLSSEPDSARARSLVTDALNNAEMAAERLYWE
jgi:lysophospholipid acyltransferase (LPLAT)-like uncharacterized protein